MNEIDQDPRWRKILVRNSRVHAGPLLHGLRSQRQFSLNGQGQQPNGSKNNGGGPSVLRQPADNSSSSQSNSRHSIQHEGHQRCLVFGKLSSESAHQQNQQQHNCCHPLETGVLMAINGRSHSSHSGRWMSARNHLISAWLPTLSSPPSLEIYDSLNRNQTYRRTNSSCCNNKETQFADTKI